VAGLQQRLQARGKDSGEKYDCLLKIGRRCAELLLRMYAEDDDIMLMDDLDYHWVRKIVACANGLLKDVPGAV